MLNWLNRSNPSAAAAAGYPQPALTNWRNREQTGETRGRTLEPAQPVPRKRRLRLLEVLSIAVVIALIVGVDLYIFGINKRLYALETKFNVFQKWALPASLLEGKYASLNARLRALTDAYAVMNEKLALIAAQQHPVNVATGTPGYEPASDREASPVADAAATDGTIPETAEPDLPSDAPAAGAPVSTKTSGLVQRAEPEPAAAPPMPEEDAARPAAGPASDAERMPPVARQEPAPAISEEPAAPAATAPTADTQPSPASPAAGAWVINLLSDPSETLAARFADKARARGVTVEQNRTEVKGRVYWRVQITGFATAGEARTRAEEIKKRLDLKDVWVFRQAG
jgi:hypothetical protein